MDKITSPDDYKYSQNEEKDREIRNATNLIRLITRIIFIWFIKEKELINEDLFDKTKLKNIVKDFGEGNNYYNAILQNLFFASLNQKVGERKFAKEDGYPVNKSEYGVKTLFRYRDKFNIGEEEVLKLFKDIPFLNGGLFDCLDKEDETGKVIYIDGFSRNPDKQAKIPDFLFFQKEETNIDLSQYGLGKNKPVRGLLEILKSYNFTIDESTPVDQEVALDPELLGKVFENLLACYNPETSTTARKSTGSYYTPREIVDYMVDQSLKEYLKNSLPSDRGELEEELDEKITLLLSYTDEAPEITEEEKEEIIRAIANIKILDPACGSGAFPMGILHKLLLILQKIDPENKYLYKIQKEKHREIEHILKSDDKDELEELLNELEETFDEKLNYPDYARKKYLIENCIYGVDIQPIAIQISKLRFFISLILDQKVNKTKDNFGIRPLPNLETKFVSANTLIGLERPKQLSFRNPKIDEKEKELKELRHRYFSAKTRTQKLRLQQKDKKIREEISKLLVNDGWDIETAKKIANFDLFDQNASADWFDPEWMFGINDGYDIVIGNPPYIKEYTNRQAFDGLRSSPYYQGKMDIWYFFVCVGLDLLTNSGILTFIAQNNWITNFGAKKMRNKVIIDSIIKKLIDFGPYFIFESSGTQTMIMVFKKDTITDNYSFEYLRIRSNNPAFNDVLDILRKNNNPNIGYLEPIIKRSECINKPLNFSDTDIEQILKKIKTNGPFNLLEEEIAQGIVCPQDFLNKKNAQKLGNKFPVGTGIFIISDEEKRSMNLTSEELKIIKPYYTTEELSRYYGSRENNYWIIYAKSDMNKRIHKYPNIKRHLDRFKKIITSDFGPYGLHRARDERFFQGKKIISLRKCQIPTFTYTDFDCYVSQTFFIIKTDRINMKYLTGVLNSKIVSFWLNHKGKKQGNQYQIDKEPLMNIPIPPLTPQNKPLAQKIETLVEEILKRKSQNPNYDTTNLEKEIDRLIYQLYALNDKEITVVEGR
ncbi:hypothetical protein A45J_2547 [hot springs metagenome]|uniref:site-specific DNA-methyltransferase (adenine-specific) n=1 Tax=hot springs metagenome TaxID=433727 RepID=A0A5J4L669_9ZZZZ